MSSFRCLLLLIILQWVTATSFENSSAKECLKFCSKQKTQAEFDEKSAICKCLVEEKTVEESPDRQKREESEAPPTESHAGGDAVVGQRLPRPRRIRPIARRPIPPRRTPTPPRPISPETARQIMQSIRHRLRTMSDRAGIGSRSSQRNNEAAMESIRANIRQLSSGVVITDPQQRARATANRANTINQTRQRELQRQQRIRQLRNRSQLQTGGIVGSASASSTSSPPSSKTDESVRDFTEKSPPRFQIITQPPDTIDE